MAKTLAAPVALCVVVGFAAPSIAGLIVPEWYFGKWDCLIDGRASEMEWRAREVQNTVCNGDVCTTSSGVEITGSFRDGSGPLVTLKRVVSNAAMVQMRHPDGNLWYLAKQRTRAEGWTTWNGQRYSLSCARKGSGRYKQRPRP